MRRLSLAGFLLLCSSLAFGTATVSGKLVTPAGTGAVPGYVQFDLQNCNLNVPTVSGATIAPQQKFTLNSDGTWSGVMYRNDEISCNGSFSTWWHKSYFVNFRQVGQAADYLCSQATCVFDGTGGLTPITVYPAPAPPAQPLTGAESVVCSFPVAASTWTCTENMGTQQVVAQFYDSSNNEIFPDNANATDVNTFTATWLNPQAGFVRVVNVGNWTPSVSAPNYLITNPTSDQAIVGNHALTLGGNLSILGSVVSNNTFTGSNTFSGALNASGTVTASNALFVCRLGNVRIVDAANTCAWSGANAGAWIDSACADLPSGGGTIDARQLGAGVQTFSSTRNCGSVSKPVKFSFDRSTLFRSSTSSLNLWTVNRNNQIDGFTFDCSTQASYSGIVFQNDPTQFYTNGDTTSVSNVTIRSGTSASCGNSSGTALKLSSTDNTLGVGFFSTYHWRVWGLSDGIFSTTSGTGFVNGNHFVDMEWSNSAHGWHQTGSGASGAQQANICSPCSYEKDASGTNGWLIDGSVGNVEGNQFIGSIWDTTVPISVTNTVAIKNKFAGRYDGTISDVNNLNNFESDTNASSVAGLSYQGIQDKVLCAGSANNTFDIFDITASAANPHKYFRVCAGVLQLLDSAFSNDIVDITNVGLGTFKGGLDANSVGLAHVGALSGVTSTAPVANLNASPVAYNHSGAQQVSPHMVFDTCTLGTSCSVTFTGSAVFTTSASYQCTASDASATNAVEVNQTSGSAVAFTGTGTDVVRYVCVGT